MKDNKTAKIEVRLTPEEKEKIKSWCAERHITMSECVRWMCQEIFMGDYN